MPLKIAAEKKGVHWHGSFFVYHSLALVNRELSLALLNHPSFADRYALGLEGYEPDRFTPDADPRFGELAARTGKVLDNVSLTIRHRWPPEFSRPQSGHLVLIQPWEFGSIPQDWVTNVARTVEEIWVPTNFVRDSYVNDGVPAEKVVVVPNGVNTTRFHPNVTPYDFTKNPATKHIKEGTYKFLFVGGTLHRKGIDVLLDAYDRAFTGRDNVTLIVKDFGTDSFYANQGAGALIKALQAKPGGANIVYLTDDMSEAEIASLYAACDCLVHPYRGEGYGLPVAEAMACGKPTIVTGFGAALDFANTSNAYLIPAVKQYLPDRKIGDLVTAKQPFLAEPNRDALIETLRRVVSEREEAATLGAKAAADIIACHTWNDAARIALARIEALAERPVAAAIPSVFNLPFNLGNLSLGGGLTATGLNRSGLSLTTPGAEAIGDMFEERKQAALSLTRQGLWEEAAAQLEACLKERSDDYDLINALAVALFRTDCTDRAVELLRHGIEKAPNVRDFRHNLAFILLEAGKAEEALGNALESLAFSPDNADIRRLIERSRNAVLQDARKILRHVPDSRRFTARRDPEYRRLMHLYQDAGEKLKTARDPIQAIVEAKPRLSLCMIVKNEERFLRNCLESAKDYVDEIVIVDTGSTDSTLDIAREYGAKIVSFEWTDDFSEARNVSLNHATGNWALWLDADEEIVSGSGPEFRQSITDAPAHIGAYMVEICNWLSGTQRQEGSEMAVHHACRLFRLVPGVQFEGRIHEQNLRSLQRLGFKHGLRAGLTLDHFGYVNEVMESRNKHERFLRMLHREVEECPDETFRGFHLFNLGNSYFTAGDMPNAVRYLSEAALTPDSEEEFTRQLFTELATAYHRLGRSPEGLEACERADTLGIVHTGIEFARGFCLLHLLRYPESEMAFRKALTLGEQETGFATTGDRGLSSFKARYGLGLAMVGQDRFDEALPHLQRAVHEQASFNDARYLLSIVLTNLDRTAEAVRELQTILDYDPQHIEAARDLGNLFYAAKDYAAALPFVRTAAAQEPGNLEMQARLASCYEQLGLHTLAREAYEHLRMMAPESVEVCVNLGRVLAASGAEAEAIDCFADAIMINPRYGNAYFNAGDLLYKMGYYARAAETYMAGLEIDPENANGFFVLGNCLTHTEDYAAAILSYRQALKQDPTLEAARHNLSLAEEQLPKAA